MVIVDKIVFFCYNIGHIYEGGRLNMTEEQREYVQDLKIKRKELLKEYDELNEKRENATSNSEKNTIAEMMNSVVAQNI